MIASRSAGFGRGRLGRGPGAHARLGRLARRELPDAVGQKLHVERFEHVVVGAHFGEALGDVVPGQGGQDDDPRALFQVQLVETLQHREAVQPRHRDVQHHHVGADFFDHIQRLFAVVRAADHLHVALCVEELGQRRTELNVVVRDQHLDQHRTLLGAKIREV